jgi:hypothetical protein
MPLRHLIISRTEHVEPYRYPLDVGRNEFPRPARDRIPHAEAVARQLRTAAQEARERDPEGAGVILEFSSDPGFTLWIDSLENRGLGIELLNVRAANARQLATVYVPLQRIDHFIRRAERYAQEETAGGNPRHANLIESIGEVRLAAVRSFWTDSPELFPQDPGALFWWEVWLRIDPNLTADQCFANFVVAAANTPLRFAPRVISFPERIVVLAFGDLRMWTATPPLLELLAELRRAKEVPTEYLRLRPGEQREYVHEAAARVNWPPAEAPAVCLLDTGVRRANPLLAGAIAERDVIAVSPEWNAADHDGHGTAMAGIALYRDGLADFIASGERLQLRHRLESVKLLPQTGGNHPDSFGALTEAAVGLAEVQEARRQRVVCMAVTTTDARDDGYPSSWSAAIDQHSAGALDGVHRLYVLAVGNIDEVLGIDGGYVYPDSNREQYGIKDPGQSWNGLTVGAFTNRVVLPAEEAAGVTPVAPLGGLCPSSRTSMMWHDKVWPIKPDVVLEGGNYLRNREGEIQACDDLELLTTTVDPVRGLLSTMRDTSAAAAQAAAMAATIQAEYPDLWPETVRGLMVHSARWTRRMVQEFPPQDRQTTHQLLRCYGYGVPDLDRAMWSLRNHVDLVYQGELQPFELVNNLARTRDYHLHELPWPRRVLQELGEEEIRVRVTLSYFIEPSPDRRGYRHKHRYASHGLRFKVKGPTESVGEFRQRVSRHSWEDPDAPPDNRGELQPWFLGPQLRAKGSIHSDGWKETAANIAECSWVAVHPVTGWWKERKHLGKVNSIARYSLIISLRSDRADVDLYTPIANQIGVPVEIPIG